MLKKKLFLLDATAFCYRAFYALRTLSTSFGQPTNAIYGFINILQKLLKAEKPEYLAVCFDVSRETFRQKKFAEYKIQRQPMPEGLVGQLPLIKQIVAAYGIKICEKEGFEADDVIATLCSQATKAGFETVIVSSDKDILQLVGPQVTVISPHKEENLLYTSAKVTERFGVPPERIADIIALMGDDTDNIPGARGIGEKTATNLIQTFGSLENLLKNIDDIKQERTRVIIRQNLEMIRLSRELAELDRSVPLELSLQDLIIRPADTAELMRIFQHLEFKKMLKGLVPDEADNTDELDCIDDARVKGTVAKDLALYIPDAENNAFASGGNHFCVKAIGPNLKSVLLDARVKKTGYDLKKTKVMLAGQGIGLEGFSFDVMIASHLCDPAKPSGNLADIAWNYLAKPAGKTLSPSKALGLIMEAAPKLKNELRDKSLEELFVELEMPLSEVLAEMEQDGIKLDTVVLTELSRDIEKRLVKLIEEIYALSGTEFNINSPKQLREVLFVKLKLPVGRKSKTGPSTDEEVLRSLADKHKLPAFLLEYRQLSKLKNTYIDALPALIDKAGLLHTCFNQTATETGRLSSSNPNLQNIPVKTDIGKIIRRAFIARAAENCLLSCDYSQVELRILAHLSGDEALSSSFLHGHDVHKATAALIYGVEVKDVQPPMRDMAKRINFSIIYGLTSYGLSRDLSIPVDEAQRFIDAYFMRYPKVALYIERQIKIAEENGFVTTLLGRRRYIPEIKNKNQGIRQFAQRQAVNTPVQGTASDLIKMAMVQIQGLLKEKKSRAKMILQVHDELVFDLPRSELAVVSAMVRERMEHVLRLDVPIKVEMKTGKNWLEMEDYK